MSRYRDPREKHAVSILPKGTAGLRSIALGAALLALLAPRPLAAVEPGLQPFEVSQAKAETEASRPPRTIFMPRPAYPAECRKKGIEGKVLVDFVVCPDGTTSEIKAFRGPDPLLAQAAMATIARTTFVPGTRNGVPVYFHLEIPIVFSLNPELPEGVKGIETVKPDHPPSVAFAVPPQYPPEFVSKRVEGAVLVKFTVCPDGTTTAATAVQASDKRLIPFALQAILRWRFKPGTKNGVPVYCELEVPLVFKAEKPKARAVSDTAFDAASDADALLAKGSAALEAKAYGDAEQVFTAAIRMSPDSAAGYLGRARAYGGLGREDEALDDYSRAALLDASARAAMEAYKGSLPDTPERRWSALRYATFNTVWRTVDESYYDPTFGGVSWLAVREKYRLLLPATDSAHLLSLLQQMLGELRRTHFTIIPRAGAVFNPSERVRIGTAGIDVAWVEGGVVVTEVTPDSRGALAPVAAGEQIVGLDGTDLPQLEDVLTRSGVSASRAHLYLTQLVESRLSGAVGTKVRLRVAGTASAPREVAVTCGPTELPWSEPIGYFPSVPIRCKAERGPDGIALFKFNVFVPPVMKRYRELERSLGPGDALIIDLRGNGGGLSVMASGICGWLCSDPFVLASMHQRTGPIDLGVYPQAHGFPGPVAILIDGQSASTSEILAAGLKEHHRVRVFGEPSAGAALPSLFKTLPTGDLLQYAVADVTTPSGALLEGNGVAPDEPVPLTRADLAAGRDPVEDSARRWIAASHQAQGAASATTGG